VRPGSSEPGGNQNCSSDAADNGKAAKELQAVRGEIAAFATLRSNFRARRKAKNLSRGALAPNSSETYYARINGIATEFSLALSMIGENFRGKSSPEQA